MNRDTTDTARKYFKLLGRLMIIGPILTPVILVGISFAVRPEPKRISIPHHNGRIELEENISPGTFVVKRHFDDVSSWGADTIISWVTKTYQFKLVAWRPDPDIPGVFQFAEQHVWFDDQSIWDKLIVNFNEEKGYLELSRHWSQTGTLILLFYSVFPAALYGCLLSGCRGYLKKRFLL